MGENRRKEPEKYGRRAGASGDTGWRRRGMLRHFPIIQYGHRQRTPVFAQQVSGPWYGLDEWPSEPISLV
ncbi:hypothetical protein CHQ57_10420 [Aeromonas salmonicida]|nr:hypothetical protein CHQ57_10420 [Aeromonas salmonicida]